MEALIVFAKPPVAGQVKTRLFPLLAPDEAAELYHAFLADSIETYRLLGPDLFLYFTESTDALDVPDRPSETTRFQKGESLADRLLNAFSEVLNEGYRRVVAIGTDHPSLPLEFLAEAFEALSGRTDVVLGPAEDGGYYLMGMRRLVPELLLGMRFSHSDVFSDTVRRADDAGLSLRVLPVWYDVDTPDDLPRLFRDLSCRPSQSPRTLRLLRGMASRYGWQNGS